MNTHADKTQKNKSQSVSSGKSQMQSSGESTFQFVDNRPEAVAQRKLQEMANNSPQTAQLRTFQGMANESKLKNGAPLQMMSADPDFLEKHTAKSKAEAIGKSKTRTGKWKTNSIMDFSDERTLYNFEHDATKSGPFSVASGGWEIKKIRGGRNFKGSIEERYGNLTGTAKKKSVEDSVPGGIANHSDGWKDGGAFGLEQID